MEVSSSVEVRSLRENKEGAASLCDATTLEEGSKKTPEVLHVLTYNQYSLRCIVCLGAGIRDDQLGTCLRYLRNFPQPTITPHEGFPFRKCPTKSPA